MNNNYKDKYIFKAPIPMPRGTHYGSDYWLMPSRKLGRVVTAYSTLEHVLHTSIEMDYRVEYYCEQPLRIELPFKDGRKKTVFDAFVAYKDGKQELIEIKYKAEYDSSTEKGQRDREQVEVQKQYAESHGYSYRLVTDVDLKIGTRLYENLSVLARRARTNILSQELRNDIYELKALICRYETPSIDKLCRFSQMDTNRVLNALSEMYYEGKIRFSDITDSILNAKTEVYINDSEEI